MDISTFSKAIAGGLVAALVALGARYGFQLDPPTMDALGFITTAVIAYVVGHVAVYVAPANKRKI